ncbi:MAG TPA: sensor histidine kinase [Gaiellaceae bacterium]
MSSPANVQSDTRRLLVRARVGVAIGLLFLAGPVSDLARSSLAGWRVAAISVAFVAFVVIYLLLLPPVRVVLCVWSRIAAAALAALVLLASSTLALGAPGSFVSLYVYVVAVAGMMLPPPAALGAIALTASGVGIGMAETGSTSSSTVSIVLTIVAVGLMMAAFGRQIRLNNELREAREELAGMAVAEERLRIARDLHDLLGHSLSIVALKSDLAARLVERDPKRAAAELADVQAVTRRALAEVREAVQGYRQLALVDAVEGARTALEAAGIAYRLDTDAAGLPAEVESTLAWAVREGTTNVVRHSGASLCEIHVRADGDRAEVEVRDDGTAPAAEDGGGSGLRGLAERAERIRGSLVAGPGPDGGFLLRLVVPLEAS